MRPSNPIRKATVQRTPQSRTFTERRRKRRIWAAALGSVALFFWAVAIWSFVNAQWFAIRSISVYGADPAAAAALQSSARAALEGRYFGLFDRSSTLVYPHDYIQALAASSSPRVAGATVAREGLHGIGITLTQKTSSAIICVDLPDWNGAVLSTDAATDCSFADLEGKLFDAAPSFSGSAYNRYYIPSLDRSVGAGSRFGALQKFYEGVRAAGIEPLGMLVGDGGEYELYIANKSATTTVIVYANEAGVLDEELSNLAAFWDAVASKPAGGGKSLPTFDYIDVRYAPNIFYRLSEHGPQEPKAVPAKK